MENFKEYQCRFCGESVIMTEEEYKFWGEACCENCAVEMADTDQI